MLRWLIDKCRNFAKTPPQRDIPNKRDPEFNILIGCQKFEELANRAYPFVDKTLFIHKLLELENNAIWFTRPRGWGKTLNLSMLETFFQPDIDETTGEIFYNTKSIYLKT